MNKTSRATLYAVAACLCFMFACCSGVFGVVGMLAEHPDKEGHIVAADQSGIRVLIGGVGFIALIAGGAFFIAQVIRVQSTK